MIDYDKLQHAPRLLAEAELEPMQGTRFQPTGFPDLGAAVYTLSDGTDMLLVESAQSMANRLETVCWDEAAKETLPCLQGMPYVKVLKGGAPLTNSMLESHRLNSPYILESQDMTFYDTLKQELGVMEQGPVNLALLAQTLFKYDPASLLHGIFLAKKDLAGGRLRLPRSLSSFIEAQNIRVAASGGVKKDEVNPKGEAAQGFGHVPFARDEYVAARITAFFNIDLMQIRAFGLGKTAERFLIALALFKIRRLLDTGLRLRTACDLQVKGDLQATRPDGFVIPAAAALEDEVKAFIPSLAQEGLFASPAITEVNYVEKPKKSKEEKSSSPESTEIDEED